MPEFDFGSWPAGITAIPGARILSTMIYPDDEGQRQELYNAYLTEYYLCAMNTPGAWTCLPDSPELFRLVRVRHDGPAAKVIWENSQRSSARGYVAGEVLFLCYCLKETGQPGGVLQACHMLTEAPKQYKGIVGLGFTEHPYKNPKSLRDKAWAPYRSVAHLWAAHLLLLNTRSQMNKTEVDGIITLQTPQATWFTSSGDFLTFLQYAECFRQYGESYIPHGQRAPLLSPEETWHLPPYGSLPALTLEPSAFPKHYQQMIATYRAENMR
jgi:hypothetical protein